MKSLGGSILPPSFVRSFRFSSGTARTTRGCRIRAEITRDILSEKAGSALEFWTDSESWLERLWTLVMLGDYASVYLSFLNQEDPTPVEAIEGLKNRLKESS